MRRQRAPHVVLGRRPAELRPSGPQRTLLTVTVFVLPAGVFGGPVAGALQESGGFTATDSGSARAVGRSKREAVAIGVQRTGAVVTAAAILLAVAIGAFITSSISFIQQIGVASAAGVLIDAFVVRALLVPSLMALLGPLELVVPAAAAARARAHRSA